MNLSYPTHLSFIVFFVGIFLLSSNSNFKLLKINKLVFVPLVAPLLFLLIYLINSISAVKAYHDFRRTGDLSAFENLQKPHLYEFEVEGFRYLHQAIDDPKNYDNVNLLREWTESYLAYQPQEVLYTNLVTILVSSERYREAFYYSLESAKRYPYSQTVKNQFYPLKELYFHLENQG